MSHAARSILLPLLVVVLASCGSSTTEPKPAIHASWTWSGAATSCASIAGATQVSILATAAGTSTGYEQLVACSANQGTLALPSTGSYMVVLSLENSAGAAIDWSMAQTVSVTGTTEVSTSFDGAP